ncbi:pyruvate/2-oxoglutarate dehydrogenase complex dihydrolipoamide dehydrogenase (E3) component [Diaminobutyricimonas aerilata]|uniref:Pyruvate/2-oxoglutarate dehydrogenase complex dihydrolipoamide dehydrogenase (E3) component n=1 Tax=Diaminobutyricimonas aerilata TaxID=1162967 RepID=A0A2M9CFC3_9MICO|nr:FAD-dependent oxidoreductase [Diaminobutyricimonas aerilata]PJJ70577.1 pyruvate/2-oxoglutarate dehydrogenase complex dihydrolipoamide dehydrogenase (E3) component [Diaminobutyricimonas aerilata]
MSDPTVGVAERQVDLAVVGAGPAGLSAAVVAAENGLTVALVDASPQAGGQYWRHPDERHLDSYARPESTGHHHWPHFRDLRTRLSRAVDAGRVLHLAGRQVWQVLRPEGAPFALRMTPTAGRDASAPADRVVHADRLVIATGAYDRQLPVPGWTLPGVMAAGGVQALYKANQVVAGRRAVVAGTGPFLLSVAAGLADAGVEVVAVCEANALSRWAATPLRATQEPGKLLEGVGYARTFLRDRIPYRTRTIVTEVRGRGRAESVVTARVDGAGRVRPGTERELEADLVAFGWGFTPQLELAVNLGLDTRIDVDESLVVRVDDAQRTSLPGVYAAGETTGIGGAVQSCAEGELAALTAVADAAATAPAERSRRLARRIRRGRRFAIGMHRASPVPRAWSDWVRPDTIVCRCEEVDAAAIAETVTGLDADDPRDVRVTARPGMGWCQGRVCGFAVSKLTAEHSGCAWTREQLEPLQKRPIGVPLRLSDVAELDIEGRITP